MNAGPRNGQDPEARAVEGLVDGAEALRQRGSCRVAITPKV